MKTITTEMMRHYIHKHIHNGYTSIASFGTCDIIFNEDYEGWVLLKADRTWDGPENDTREWLDELDDQDVINFYEENLEDEYEEMEDEDDEETA